MSGNISDFFGFAPDDSSDIAKKARQDFYCPFIQDRCTKKVDKTVPSGACAIKPVTSGSVICCPNRLYGETDRILNDVAISAFGSKFDLIPGTKIKSGTGKRVVAVFGKRWGGELRLPKKSGKGNYFMDWILALVDENGKLQEFVAVEVQTIDTTGNYTAERKALLKGQAFVGKSTAGLNWENVNKRILPQLIYKGNVLRQEPLCHKGLYFVCPTPVYLRIIERLGGGLRKYDPHPGTISFFTYDLAESKPAAGKSRSLSDGERFTTTVEQVSNAFSLAHGLPEPGVYEQAIRNVLEDKKIR